MDSLPAELLDHILSLVPASQLQQTTLSLLRALPSSPISPALLWRHLRLTREGQSFAAHLALQGTSLRSAVQSVLVLAWREDPQFLINLLLRLPNVTSLRITIGPLFQPEHIEELLENPPAWRGKVEQVWLRFNPYVGERSYYTFLKGAYFDTTPLTLAAWPAGAAPNLRRLAFAQDLPPNHGVAAKVTPAFGISQDLADELERLAPPSKPAATEGKMDFAQPIVFFKLFCITTLATSPVGSQLENLVLRLPRRNPLTAFTDFPLRPLPTPFPSLRHLDLSTTHLIADARFPLLLRLHLNLEYLVLDCCTGLIGAREADEQVLPTVRWLGKCLGGVGASRGEDVLRAWRRLIKDRPTGVAAPGPPTPTPPPAVEKKKRAGRSGYGNMPRPSKTPTPLHPPPPTPSAPLIWKSELVPLVKDILLIPPAPKMKSLGLGLFPLSSSTQTQWRAAFDEGFDDALARTAEKIEDARGRFSSWRDSGKLDAGTRRMVTLRSALPPNSPWVDWEYVEPDLVFAQFCAERDLVVIGPEAAGEVLASVRSARCQVCFVPDCSGVKGVPHLSLGMISKEERGVREEREKELWEREEGERREWKRPGGEHVQGCAHLKSRESWEEEQE